MATIKDIYIGKVRNSAILDNETRILHTTNRISAFDFIFPFTVEKKAEILQALSVYYFNKTAHIIENHFIGCLDLTHLLVKEAKVFPVEIIVRGYLTGSLWRLYQDKGTQGVFAEYGVTLPDGMNQHQKFEKPIITPSTKEAAGHDLPISTGRAAEIVGHENWKFIETKAIELFSFGQAEALKQGLILVDTKYEMGLYKNNIILVDEVHTPDSSRYWYANEKNTSSPQQMSKEFLREEIIRVLGKPENIKGNPTHHPLFKDDNVTTEIADKIAKRYHEMFYAFVKNETPEDICKPFYISWPVPKESFQILEKSAIMPDKILVVGNGGRDYSLCNAFAKLPEVDTVYYAAKNRHWDSAKHIQCSLTNVNDIALFAKENNIGLVIAGPELPIAQGISDACVREKIPVLAPSLKCVQLETSKIFCKEIVRDAEIRTPYAKIITWSQLKEATQQSQPLPPCVLKYDGLASGKGVFVLNKKEDLLNAMNSIERNFPEWEKMLLPSNDVLPSPDAAMSSPGLTGGSILNHHAAPPDDTCFLIEEIIYGEEISVIALCNGEHFRLLPTAKDYKRRNNNQTGPNTGGMGSICPVPLTENILHQVKETFSKILKTLTKEETPYYGFLFAGFMIDKNANAWLLEFNCRLGDPEAQVILPGMQRDFYAEALRTAKHLPFIYPEKSGTEFSHDGLKRVYVVGAAPEYPDATPPRRKVVFNAMDPAVKPRDDNTPQNDNTQFIPSAIEADNTTTGGRAFGILATAQSGSDTFAQTAKAAYSDLKKIKFMNEDNSVVEAHYRTDIGANQ